MAGVQLRNLSDGSVNGEVMSGLNTNPWSNHNAIRAASAGVCAIALLAEKDSHGNPFNGLQPLIDAAARDIRRYFVYGLGENGWCMEGDFYKRMTWNAGPGHLVQACRAALGIDLLNDWPGAHTLVGEWMQQSPSEIPAVLDIGDDQSSGLWPLGLTTVPRDLRSSVRWLFDRSFGLPGNGTFGIAWAYQAAYVLVNYPFDVPAKAPERTIPWILTDLRKGHWIFRRPWRDGLDLLAVLNLKSEILRGCHYERAGEAADLRLWGLGRLWISGVSRIDNGIANSFLGGRTTYYHVDPDGSAVLSIQLDDLYLEEDPVTVGAGWKSPESAVVPASFPRAPMKFIDHGIHTERHMVVDFSGTCGAPGLLVFIDCIHGQGTGTWKLPLAADAGPVRIEGQRVVVGDPVTRRDKSPRQRRFFSD